jgi:RHS repeat-associated protein
MDGFASRLRRLSGLLLLFVAAGSGNARAELWDCAAEGGSAQCPKPQTTDFACQGAFASGDSQPCAGLDLPGRQCKTEGEALDQAIDNYSQIPPPPCTRPSYGGLCPSAWNPTEMDFDLGELYWVRHAYILNLPSLTDGQCVTHSFPTCGNPNVGDQFFGAIGNCLRRVFCPPGSARVGDVCKTARSKVCELGNPMDCVTGEKTQVEQDIRASAASLLEFSRYYSSSSFYEPRGSGAQHPDEHHYRILGPNWRHTYLRAVASEPFVDGQPELVTVLRHNGDYHQFRRVGSSWVGSTDEPQMLQEIIKYGQRAGWQFQTAADEIEIYDLQGRLKTISYPSGEALTMHYSMIGTPVAIAPFEGLLVGVEDSRGRTLQLQYDTLARLVRVIDPAGAVHEYQYSEGHALTGVTRPGGAARSYLYNEPAHDQNHIAGTLLTGIVDENGDRYGTYRYSHSRVNDEWHGSANADRLTITYSSGATPPFQLARSTSALGGFEQRDLVLVNGTVKERGRKRCTSETCSGVIAHSRTGYDANGNPAGIVDYRGVVTDYDFNNRGQQLVQRDNFTQPASCPAPSLFHADTYGTMCTTGTCWSPAPFPGSSSAAPIGGGSWHYSCLQPTGPAAHTRAIEMDWHETFNRPVERRVRNASNVLESRKQWVYNTRGQLVAECDFDVDDAAAMAYVCSATTAPVASARVRRTSRIYCEAADIAVPNSSCPAVGLLRSVDGPRSPGEAGMNGQDDITTYAYYLETDESGCGIVGGSCHRKGDLHTVTDALARVSERVAYDRSGRLQRERDANGTLTDSFYDARGRLLSTTVRALASGVPDPADATTSFVYDAAGQITRVQQPDGTYLDYVYDDAHRLTEVADAAGNRIRYTLDAAGNRINEETFDSSYNPATPGVGLKRLLSREFNSFRRLVRERDAAGAITRDSSLYDSGGLLDGYDAHGNEVAVKDGRGIETRNEYDPLNRLVEMIEDYAGSDPETAGSTVQFTYDTRDNVRTITDPDGLVTTYAFDSLDNQTLLSSPDTGQTASSYDRTGNRISQADNRGVVSTYIYDALNRLVRISYPTSSLDVSVHYDESDALTGCSGSFPLGRLTRVTDSSGTTVHCYDRRGNITRRTHSLGSSVLSATFTYTLANRLASITYPGGGIAGYVYDASGRPSQLTWKANASATPVTVVTASHYPFGPLAALTYGNGRTLTKNRDQNYAIDSILSSAADGLTLQFDVGVMGNVASVDGVLGTTPAQRRYVHDNLYRITRVEDATGVLVEDYSYNRTGDRLSKQFTGQPAQAYAYLAGTHRLAAVAGAARSYDANGNTTGRSDGVSLGYDDRNRLTSIVASAGATGYDYSAFEQRTRKQTVSGATTTTSRYLHDADGRILAELLQSAGGGRGTNAYLFLDDTPVAIVRGTAMSYLESDHLDTPRVAVNPTTNAVEWRWDLLGSAFGEHVAETLVPGKSVPLRYPGQYFDAESGLSHNYRRDYEAATGRYVESDPIGLEGAWATYEYAGSAALDFTDPDGLLRRRGSGGMSCGGSGLDDLYCPDLPDTCDSRCACKHRKAIRKCTLANPRCLEDARHELVECLSTCPSREPGPGV